MAIIQLPKKRLLLLPGAYMRAQDFVTHGFIDAARRTCEPIDIVAAEPPMQAYLDGSIVAQLHAIVPAGAGPLWLAGISLGGLGALLYSRAYPDAVEGLLLIAPFIGTRGVMAEVARAGGFTRWHPPAGAAATDEHRFLHWLKSSRAEGAAARPAIHLAYGSDDRFAASYRLLAELLPAERVTTAPGGHDWDTWTALWTALCRNPPFGMTPGS